MIENLAETIEYDQLKLIEFHKKLVESTTHVVKELTDATAIDKVYKQYKGPKESLYIPEFNEIQKNISSSDSSYIGIVSVDDNDNIVALAKIERLHGDGKFFIVPDFDRVKDGKYFGFSGLISLREGKGFGKKITQQAGRIVQRLGATGMYADCNYENISSFMTLTKTMSFLGFTDGRKGGKDEQTIYTTFYKSFRDDVVDFTPNGGISLDFSNAKNLDDVYNVLIEKMESYGNFDKKDVPYMDGINTIYYLKNKIDTTKEKAKLILPTRRIELPSDYKIQNSNDNNIINMMKYSRDGR